MNALTDVQSRYCEIGTQLQFRALDTIKSRSATDGEVVEEWLKGNYNTDRFGRPALEMLVKVVANPNGGNNYYLAEKIASQHPG